MVLCPQINVVFISHYNLLIDRVVELSPSGYIYKIVPQLKLRDHSRRRSRKTVSPRGDQVVCCEIVSLSNIRSYTHEVSTTWPSTFELNKVDINEHATLDRETSTGLKELQESEKSWKWERCSSPGKTTPVGCPELYGQP